MKVASFRSEDSHSSIKHDDRPGDRLSTAVSHYSVHPFVDLEERSKRKMAQLQETGLKF